MFGVTRVFISYAHSEKHSEAVRDLADRLRANGIDAWIDQYEQAPPAGWRAWIEAELRKADFVLIVASASYEQRAESSGPLDAGQGARYESALILDDLYEAGRWNVKYVPVILLEQDRDHLPAPLRTYQRFSIYSPGGFERLLRLLTNQPATPAPQLGAAVHLPPKRRASRDATSPPVDHDLDPDTIAVEEPPPEDQPNPFDPWTPAVPPRFKGRSSELRRLDRALDTGFGVSIVGDARIGKSSILRTWQGRLAAEGRAVRFLDGQGPEGASIAAFVAKVVRQPASQVPDDADGAADLLVSWASSTANDTRPVLLVDELDGLPGRFDPRFFERLRNLIGRVVLVVVTRKEVDRLYDDLGMTSPFDNRLKLIRTGLPRAEDAEAIIELGRGHLNVDDADEMTRWAGRHPHFLQLFGHHLVDARAQGEDEEALERFLDESASRLRDLWRHLSDKEEAFLRSLVQGEEPEAPQTLIRRGVLDEEGKAFGQVLDTWLREQF